MLYLVATPIGNLKDITFRAIEVLKSCDYILCEDTRHSRSLLVHYQIHKPLKSLHKFNESASIAAILKDLKEGQTIALISDAGTPGIADPGSKLVQECLKQKLQVQAIPGPCAAIVALTASGLDTTRFQFIGFLPRKKGELSRLLEELLSYPGTTLCYESPHRIAETLKQFPPETPLVIARELTKKFEEFMCGTAQELLQRMERLPLKGEIVLLIPSKPSQTFDNLTPQQHVEQIEAKLGLSRQEAIKMAATIRGVSKRVIYNTLMK